MLCLKSVRKLQDRASVPHQRVPTFHFHYAHGFRHPNTRRHVRLLGPCFKTGRLKPLRQHPERVKWPKPQPCGPTAVLNPRRRVRRKTITHPKVPHFDRPCSPPKIDVGPSVAKYTKQKS